MLSSAALCCSLLPSAFLCCSLMFSAVLCCAFIWYSKRIVAQARYTVIVVNAFDDRWCPLRPAISEFPNSH